MNGKMMIEKQNRMVTMDYKLDFRRLHLVVLFNGISNLISISVVSENDR